MGIIAKQRLGIYCNMMSIFTFLIQGQYDQMGFYDEATLSFSVLLLNFLIAGKTANSSLQLGYHPIPSLLKRVDDVCG